MDEEENEQETSDIRKKKQTEQKRAVEARKAEEQLKAALRVALENDAYERITNVKIANAQLFLVAAQNILSLYKQIGRKINDKELLFMLHKIKEQNEKQTAIKFERKYLGLLHY